MALFGYIAFVYNAYSQFTTSFLFVIIKHNNFSFFNFNVIDSTAGNHNNIFMSLKLNAWFN